MKVKIYFDEAGRGPLAGPVVVGAILPLEKTDTSEFKDSKKLSEKKREYLFNKIKSLEEENLLFYSFGFSSAEEIDKFGIKKAINLATKRALLAILVKYVNYLESFSFNEIKIDKIKNGELLYNILKFKNLAKEVIDKVFLKGDEIKDLIIVFGKINKLYGLIFDGNTDFGLSKDLNYKLTTIIKGDEKVSFISMASIVAKVIRDKYMIEISSKYPHYLFEKHKGYGTAKHRELIIKYGVCKEHRKSFLKNIFNNINYNLKSPIE